jgi:hypothetical protein
VNWWNVFRVSFFVLYPLALFVAMFHYASFYESISVRESVQVRYGEWEIKEYSVERHTSPKKRKEEGIVAIIAILLVAVYIALMFLDTPPW